MVLSKGNGFALEKKVRLIFLLFLHPETREITYGWLQQRR